jgi:hypothetical protein
MSRSDRECDLGADPLDVVQTIPRAGSVQEEGRERRRNTFWNANLAASDAGEDLRAVRMARNTWAS